MTVYYKEEPPQLLIIVEEPHPLEEELRGATEDGDTQRIDDIFLTLYKEGRIEEIENILTRYFFSDKKIATTLERLGEKVNETITDPDYT